MNIKRLCRLSILLGFSLVCMGGFAPAAKGDGGTPRYSGTVGDYRMTVFTEPTPLRAGPADVSVLLENLQTGEIVSDTPLTILVSQTDQPGVVKKYAATTESATNQLLRAASLEFEKSGTWNIAVEVSGASGIHSGNFEVDVGPPIPRWVELGFWIGLPVIPIILFALHETLKYHDLRRKASPG